jgi:hypothetical protein
VLTVLNLSTFITSRSETSVVSSSIAILQAYHIHTAFTAELTDIRH